MTATLIIHMAKCTMEDASRILGYASLGHNVKAYSLNNTDCKWIKKQ